MQPVVHKKDLLFPELSYQIIGCAYDVFNEIGFGHPEKFYQRALAESLKSKNLAFTEQLYFPVKFQDKIVGKMFFDFLVEEKVIVEIKKDARFSKQNIDQVNQYLKTTGYQLALLINFSPTGVVYKRMVNLVKEASPNDSVVNIHS
ncbi:MAG: GxxExxY protein [Bacteroidota bacterium]|nr:GxxExxY protein [Bacteroidota bacterium]